MRLLAIRHGQASFGSDDYDRLSERGWTQTRRLGHWLSGHGEQFAHVVCGDMRRHRETCEAVAEGYASRDLHLPAADTDAGFNEFDHQAVIAGFLDEQPQHPSVLAYQRETGNLHAVGDMLRAAFAAWAAGSVEQCGEPWSEFRTRTRAAGERLLQRAKDGPILLLTSGGVIAQLAAAALQAPDARAVELNMALRNSALCEFHARPDGFRLGSWNSLPHLAEQRDLWTYF